MLGDNQVARMEMVIDRVSMWYSIRAGNRVSQLRHDQECCIAAGRQNSGDHKL